MKVGDYGYVKGISRDYGIGKITQLNSGYSSNDGELIDIQFKHFKHSIPKKNVISSPNILDLIEVGDYVNGYLVIERDINNELRYIDLKDRNMKYVKNLDIKSIVTKEQFEEMKYKEIIGGKK